MPDARAQHGVGQDPRAVELDEHGGVAEPRDGGHGLLVGQRPCSRLRAPLDQKSGRQLTISWYTITTSSATTRIDHSGNAGASANWASACRNANTTPSQRAAPLPSSRPMPVSAMTAPRTSVTQPHVVKSRMATPRPPTV